MLPIDPDWSMSAQSTHALRTADKLNLLVFRGSTDMSVPEQVDRLRTELGPDAVLPDDPTGKYYLIWVQPDVAGEPPIALNLPEGFEPLAFCLALAATRGRHTVAEFVYRMGLAPQIPLPPS